MFASISITLSIYAQSNLYAKKPTKTKANKNNCCRSSTPLIESLRVLCSTQQNVNTLPSLRETRVAFLHKHAWKWDETLYYSWQALSFDASRPIVMTSGIPAGPCSRLEEMKCGACRMRSGLRCRRISSDSGIAYVVDIMRSTRDAQIPPFRAFSFLEWEGWGSKSITQSIAKWDLLYSTNDDYESIQKFSCTWNIIFQINPDPLLLMCPYWIKWICKIQGKYYLGLILTAKGIWKLIDTNDQLSF